MKTKYRMLIVITSAACLAANAGHEIEVHSENIIILSVSPIPSPSGYLSSWIFLSAASNKSIKSFSIQYFGEREYKKIKYGAHCKVDYVIGRVDGAIAAGIKYLDNVNIVNHIECV